MRTLIGALGGAALALGGCAAKPDVQLDSLATMMTGAFSSAEQAASDPAYYDITIHVAAIWPDRTDGRWLYVEQAEARTPEAPYRQRIYRVSRVSPHDRMIKMVDDTFRSEVFLLPGDPAAWAGAWRDPGRLATLTPELLEHHKGCTLYLKRELYVYTGGTIGEGCASELRGAAYSTSVVTFASSGMSTWDRGFDKSGKQVWGPTGGPYRFDRIDARAVTPPEGPSSPSW
jgi:hypothetical protein